MHLYQIDNLTLNYKDGKGYYTAVNDVSFKLPSKGFYGIIGPSGSGKTSLLYLLSGIRKPTSGRILYRDNDFPKSQIEKNKLRKNEMGFIFQFHFLINYLNVEKNILIGANKINTKTKESTKQLIGRLGLNGLEKRKPYELSGGQKQRVALGRALINNPKVIFADEPTASLDHKTGKNVVSLLHELAKDVLVITVTHDEIILNQADGVFKMWDGKLTQKI